MSLKFSSFVLSLFFPFFSFFVLRFVFGPRLPGVEAFKHRFGINKQHSKSKSTWCLTSTETVRLIRDGEKGEKGVWRWGEREIIYLSLHCHHQNDSCIKMGSDENHFNVSLIVRDKVTRQCPQTTIFEEEGELKRIRTEVPLLTSLTPYR